MITMLSLQDEETVGQIWRLQHVAYRLEAELIGFLDIPPLLDTFETLRNCGEIFYGWIEDQELRGAAAIEIESSGTVTITRMMVDPAYFRQGIAGALIQYILQEYHSVPLFTVSTGTINTPAVTLYRKFGFRPVLAHEVAPGVELTTYHLHNV